jgi:hypothetical protein
MLFRSSHVMQGCYSRERTAYTYDARGNLASITSIQKRKEGSGFTLLTFA